ALSSLRRFLAAASGDADRFLRRDGDAYLLALPSGGHGDVLRFRTASETARRAGHAGDGDARLVALRTALESYRGDLLPEDGPAEWVVRERELLRRQAADAAGVLAAAELDTAFRTGGPVDPAIDLAVRCVEIDPCHDLGWRSLIAAHRRAGNVAAAERARREYGEVLASLGLDPAMADHPAGTGGPQPGQRLGAASALTAGRRIPPPRSPLAGSPPPGRTQLGRSA
ncbi:MAG TPA: bacterial transcriptional activator domain-containing protein, partial [Micromonospora sp.]